MKKSKTPPPAAEKRKVGRPVKYTPEWIEEEAKHLLAWVKRDEGLYLGDYCHERGYSRQRLLEFEKKSEEFAEALNRARLWQERKLLHGGLYRDMDANFAKYTMARICGPVWKASFDKEDEGQDKVIEVTINEIKR